MTDTIRRLKIFLILFVLLTLLGTLGFMKLLDLSFAEAIYYNIVTMSTVGYGDIHPKTPQGQLFAVFLIMMGGGQLFWVSLPMPRNFSWLNGKPPPG